MKPAQIAAGSSYEDKEMTHIRTVVGIFSGDNGKKSVTYIERSATETPRALYWRLEKPRHTSLTEFAEWAHRPAGTKKLECKQKFEAWLRGPADQLAKVK